MENSVSGSGDSSWEASHPRLRVRPDLPKPGDVIGDKYTIVRTIGEGGMAVVFEALHTRLGQRLAIKILRPDVRDLDVVLARFEREARATAQIRSIHTARVVDVDTLANRLPYIVLEYLEGRDLDAELRESGALPAVEAVDIALQVAEAMAEAHTQGIIHRDLKPANLFVCRAGGRRVIKILDFGISRNDADTSRITSADSYFGTPAYAPPEQLQDAGCVDARADVWSLGVVLYELLTGCTPFEGPAPQVIVKVVSQVAARPSTIVADIPPALERIVMACLERDRTKRIPSMRALADALAPFGPAQSAAAAVAVAQGPRGRLGEILIAHGLLTDAGLSRGLDEQRRTGKLLGAALIDMGLVARADLLAALAGQQRMDAAQLDSRDAVTVYSPARPAVEPAPRPRRGLARAMPFVSLAVVSLLEMLR